MAGSINDLLKYCFERSLFSDACNWKPKRIAIMQE